MLTLRVIGGLYVLSALWCIFQLDVSSSALGFELINDSARVEYLSVYGGLQLGLGMAMWFTSFKPNLLKSALFFGLIFSSFLFLIRLIGVAVYNVNELMWMLLFLEGFIALAFGGQCYRMKVSDR